mgnify:FL=1
MNRLKASAALVCTLLIAWSQIIQPYCAYALSAQSVATSQSVQQSSNDCGFQGESSQDGQDDASGFQGVTEWYGDDASAVRPDGDSGSVSDDQSGIGTDELGVDDSAGEASADDSIRADFTEADSLAPNSWRYANGALTDAGNEGIDAQSLADEALPNGAVARGIDVSNFQGTIDWNQVKAAGIEFAILKVGPVYGKPDPTFERNATECERLGIPYGVYYYSYARSVADANKEADRTLAWLGGHFPSLPVYYDLEDSYILQDSNFSKDKLVQIAQTFCNRMEAVGFKAGIYANLNWFNNYLNSPSLSGYDHWVAQYNWRCDYAGSYSFWQYCRGNVPGVNGPCDMNYCFNGSYLNVDDGKMHVQYEAHVSNIGWMSSKRDGYTAGTTGQSKAVGDIKVSILNPVVDGSVQIDAHVSGIGWQGWDTPSASEGGTTGQGRAVEAVRLRLTGSLAKGYDVYYRVHASNIGWMAWAKDGEEAGTTGFGRSVEAVQIRLVKKGDAAPSSDGANVDYAFKKKPMSLTYRAHVSNVGCRAPSRTARPPAPPAAASPSRTSSSRSTAPTTRTALPSRSTPTSLASAGRLGHPLGLRGGTTGQGRAVEAVRLRLTAPSRRLRRLLPRPRSNIGWMAWAKDGGEAGTTGMSCSLEAIQIKLIKKGASHPDTSGYSHLEIPTVTYSSQVKGAWQNTVSAGEVSGTTGQGIPITGFSAKTTSSVAGGINYQLHFSNVGWTSGKSNGGQLSSTAESNSVEAIKVSLSGDLATYFDVWYRVHVDNVGWLGWTRNGAVAGSTGYGTHVQAVQVRLTRKGANAPGSTVSPCLLGQPSAFENPMQKKIVDLARQVPSPGPGLCSEWIADIYERAGFRNVHTDACDYYWDYCKYTDYSQLKVGMVIAVPSHTHTHMGSIYGHVCLYIGNNQVMDNIGQIRTLDMAYWLNYYSTSYKPKWGWYDNVPLA